MNAPSPNYQPSFWQPPIVTTSVWRYMELPKLLSLIVDSALHLARIDCMPDKFEGLYPPLTGKLLQDRYAFITEANIGEAEGKILAEQYMSAAAQHRKIVFVNCWHYGDTESEAMWRLYCPTDSGLAIRLSYKVLFDSLPVGSTWLGMVRYIDHAKVGIPTGNVLEVAMHKRIEFEYEKEARIIQMVPVSEPPFVDLPNGERRFSRRAEDGHRSVKMPWSPALIDSIVISPYASPWYFDTVRATVDRLSPGLGAKVEKSSMVPPP